ncbi:nucleotidyltransferase domain-containing protein [Nocardiopsis sediminis]|uniref:Nucleotidyltransferase domain-containing protein n=1 Tax=Nocardiopsis sediminis TaxID=1778267 RepID=A0ABV8FG09_9ACTN
MRLDDQAFTAHVTDTLARLKGVHAVALGGSRATGTHTADSDFDFAVYYRHRFDPGQLRHLGWEGEVFGIGEWGGGVFNGGAWLQVDGRRVDVHYRDLDDVEFRLAEAQRGRFDVERLAFHLAGVPTYIVVAELAVNEVLHGELPRPRYPGALRTAAPDRWWGEARLTLDYARTAHAQRGHLADTVGAIAVAAAQAAHAVMAARGTWVTNEKRLLDSAGVRGVDTILSGLDSEPATLMAAADAAAVLLGDAVAAATEGGVAP